MSVIARHLILDLVLARHPSPCSVRELIAAGKVFAMSDNSVRVAVARLVHQDLLRSAGRGCYRMGPAAVSLAQEVRAWRQAENRMQKWGGNFLIVYTADLGRSDRKQLREMDRALSITGFREWRRGLYVRPDNLADELGALQVRLHSLGLPASALLARVDGDSLAEEGLRELWPIETLHRQYRDLQQRLSASRQQAVSEDLAEAARDCFVLGDAAIRAVVFDPLLPAQWVDAPQRQAFFAEVQCFEVYGRDIWMRYFAQVLPEPKTESLPLLQRESVSE